MAETEPAIVVEHRKELSYLLCQAAEIEHLAMCQYLYAAFSLRTEPGPGMTIEQLEVVNRWRTEIGRIAGEEMLHWGLVNNLLTAIGSAPFVSRPDLPHRAKGYPPSVQFALLPFGLDALHHFVYFERPEDVALEDVEAFAPVGVAPAPMAATELQPRGQDFVTQGQLYRSLDTGLRHLAEKMGEDGLFIGPPWAQATTKSFGWSEMVAVHDLDSAMQVLNTIVSQGEGASGETAGSHYARFKAILDELKSTLEADPSFVPAHPVSAAIVRTVEGAPPSGPQITDPTTAAVSDLFNVVYDLILQMLCRFFAFGHETDEQSTALAHASVGLMFGAIRPLGTLLASLPVGPDHPGETAGANFQLAYKSNFLLPHRRVAWIRFSERLDEAADYAETISGGEGATEAAAKALTAVAGSLRSTLTKLASHIEPV